MDWDSGKFTALFPPCEEEVFYSDNPKLLEVYHRIKPEGIPYGEPSNERVRLSRGVVLCLRVPMEFIPDPRTVFEDAQDKEMDERKREEQRKREDDERAYAEMEKVARMEERKNIFDAMRDTNREGEDMDSDEDGGSEMTSEKMSSQWSKSKKSDESDGEGEEDEKSGDSMEESGESDDDFGEEEKDDTFDDPTELPSHSEMKRELINAIQVTMKEKQERLVENWALQIEIMLRDSQFDSHDKQHDIANNEHKYLNTLANVHQVRFNLKETQERYNKMASELQAKLNEK